ncbi:MAG: DUF3592 domain-containing protein [Anaerolineales bacterium]|uniref:DUF3592 domain-containing protein n=1 Tax=Candidatus Villigracilis vicinus TaxID=3140679 RepID=UPI003135DE54|nr:DUF3592 domain-containing protein [Anaerolineales bacterium]
MDTRKQDRPYQHKNHQNSSSGRRCSFILGLIYVGVSLTVLALTMIAFFNNTMRYNLLKREGITAAGVITKKIHNEPNPLSRRKSHYFYVVYQYTALVNGSPAHFETTKEVRSDLYFRYQVGQAIEILYVASDPKISAIKADLKPEPLSSIPLTLIIVAFVVLFGYGGVKGMLDALDA